MNGLVSAGGINLKNMKQLDLEVDHTTYKYTYNFGSSKPHLIYGWSDYGKTYSTANPCFLVNVDRGDTYGVDTIIHAIYTESTNSVTVTLEHVSLFHLIFA